MESIEIGGDGAEGWRDYAAKVGFVPDPMILRVGEVFLNGAAGARLGRDEADVTAALGDNIAGISDFFDLLVTREVLPLIHYQSSFDAATVARPLPDLLADRICDIVIDHNAYERIRAGAVRNMNQLDLARLAPLAHELRELDALRYEWQPKLSGAGAEGKTLRETFARADEPLRMVGHFLLGGFIFGGFAQASGTEHYIQPKRSRMLLGMTVADEQTIRGLGRHEEERIYSQAETAFRQVKADVEWQSAIPPVLPYLVGRDPEPRSTGELLERALRFRESDEGRRYRAAAAAIRGDGVAARRTADLSAAERKAALAMLEPYSRLEPQRSTTLKVALDLLGVGKIETSFPLGAPRWLRLWWNDYVGFGTMRKTLRRMWMAEQSYRDFSGKLLTIWRRS